MAITRTIISILIVFVSFYCLFYGKLTSAELIGILGGLHYSNHIASKRTN